MSSSRKDRPALATHQPGSQNATSYVPLSIDQFLQFFRIPFPLHRDLRRCGLQLPEIVGRQLDRNRSDVLFEPVQLRRTRDGHERRLLRKQPSERDLRGRRFLLLRKFPQQVHQSLIRSSVLRREARYDIAEIVLVELRILVDLPSKEAFTKRTEGNESDPKFLEHR